MVRFLSGAAIAVVVACSAATAASFDEAKVRQGCIAEHRGDAALVAYCAERQHEAFDRIEEYRAASLSGSDQQAILSRCEDRHRTDFTLIDYCIAQEEKAKRDIEFRFDDVPFATQEDYITRCKDAEVEYVMIRYCVDQKLRRWREQHR